jgi:hypothetical protein
MQIIAFDSHKRYSLASVETEDGRLVREERISHHRGEIRRFLNKCQAGAPVAVETIGPDVHRDWIIDEVEQAGNKPRLVHARKAKLMLGCINKTDKLDVRGLNKLQRTRTLPTVWIPPGDFPGDRRYKSVQWCRSAGLVCWYDASSSFEWGQDSLWSSWS